MDRRTALATAGAVAIITVTGGAAVAANLGVLDRPADEPAGQLQPADAEMRTIVVEPAPADTAGSATTARTSVPADRAAVAGDDHGDDDHNEADDHGDDDDHAESEEHEYEGRDDDD